VAVPLAPELRSKHAVAGRSGLGYRERRVRRSCTLVSAGFRHSLLVLRFASGISPVERPNSTGNIRRFT
jgi:hypothetical protein